MFLPKLLSVGILLNGALFTSGGAEAASFKTLYAFTGTYDGYQPTGGLLYKNGTLYGTTTQGGTIGAGTIFGLNAATGAETFLFSFNTSDGQYPVASMLYDAGYLYGTTLDGGANGEGEVFRFDPGSNAINSVVQFNNTNGNGPRNNVVKVGKLLYGTTESGGAYDYGTVFAVDPVTGAEKVIYSFTGNADGGLPLGGLLYLNGILYGTTSTGGAGLYYGVVFQVEPSTGKESVLHSFTSVADGYSPSGSLIAVGKFLYGMTLDTIFKIDPTTGAETTVHSFGGGTDGNDPQATLIAYDGKLYGTTFDGGAYNYGTVFSFDTKTQTETIIHNFSGKTDQGWPEDTLIEHGGKLYGTTYGANHMGPGSVFEIKP